MTRFVILAVPRTGSNLLCTLLNSHRQILCHHEVFNPNGIFTALDHREHALAAETLQQRDADPLGFLERVWQTATDESCVGFKWTRGQNEDVLNHVLNDTGVKKVVLRRRNRIKTFVSEKIAQETQQWEVYSHHELNEPRPRVRVDAGELLDHIASNQQFYTSLLADLARYEPSHFLIEYESLFDREVQRNLLAFLDLSADVLALTAASVKQNSTDLRDSIANFSELKSRLRDGALVTELLDRGF